MDLSTITTAQFQAQFFRDFPYLPTWSITTYYAADQVIYYAGQFWESLVNSNYDIQPGTDASKWRVVAGCANDYVQPQDITNAFAEAQMVFNQALFLSDPDITLAYLYCTAHYLVNDLRAAMQGVESTGNFPVASRSVGSMSESYQIPDTYRDNAQLAFFTSTAYGNKYLAMVMPRLVGNIGHVFGGTNP